MDGLRIPNSDLESHFYRVDGRPEATDIEYRAIAGLAIKHSVSKAKFRREAGLRESSEGNGDLGSL